MLQGPIGKSLKNWGVGETAKSKRELLGPLLPKKSSNKWFRAWRRNRLEVTVTKEESIRYKGIILLKMSRSRGEFLF